MASYPSLHCTIYILWSPKFNDSRWGGADRLALWRSLVPVHSPRGWPAGCIAGLGGHLVPR